MSFDDLNEIWDSPQNQPLPREIERAKTQFATTLKHAHRGFIRFITIVGTVLTVITVVFLLELIWPDPEGVVDFANEWAILPLFALPWVALVYSVARYRRHRNQHPDYERTIQASLQAMLDENRITRLRNRFIGSLQIVLLLLLPLVVHQLKAAGKAGDEINAMLILFPIVFVGILSGMFYHYRRYLLPRKQKLEALLNAYSSSAE